MGGVLAVCSGLVGCWGALRPGQGYHVSYVRL